MCDLFFTIHKMSKKMIRQKNKSLDLFGSCCLTSPPDMRGCLGRDLSYATHHWNQRFLQVTPWDFRDPCYQGLLLTVSFDLKTDSWHSKVLTGVVSALLIVSLVSTGLNIKPSVRHLPVPYWQTDRQPLSDAVSRDSNIPQLVWID